jgi:hypothetical protein
MATQAATMPEHTGRCSLRRQSFRLLYHLSSRHNSDTNALALPNDDLTERLQAQPRQTCFALLDFRNLVNVLQRYSTHALMTRSICTLDLALEFFDASSLE